MQRRKPSGRPSTSAQSPTSLLLASKRKAPTKLIACWSDRACAHQSIQDIVWLLLHPGYGTASLVKLGVPAGHTVEFMAQTAFQLCYILIFEM